MQHARLRVEFFNISYLSTPFIVISPESGIMGIILLIKLSLSVQSINAQERL